MAKVKITNRFIVAGILIVVGILFELTIAITASNFRNFNMRRFIFISNPDEIRVYYHSTVSDRDEVKVIKDFAIIRKFLMNMEENSSFNVSKTKISCKIEFLKENKRLLSKAKVYLSGNIPFMLFKYRFQKSHNKISPEATKMIEEWIQE